VVLLSLRSLNSVGSTTLFFVYMVNDFVFLIRWKLYPCHKCCSYISARCRYDLRTQHPVKMKLGAKKLERLTKIPSSVCPCLGRVRHIAFLVCDDIILYALSCMLVRLGSVLSTV
jgi:hypothetical protein